MNEALKAYMATCQQRVEVALERALPPPNTLPARLHQAMRYSALSGGKRIRPLLVYAAGQAVAVVPERLDLPACAVELIHAYSLVHDDLPAMDDDDLRRNQPTCHKAFDEATAILVGDALQTLAFQVLCSSNDMQADAETRLKMLEALARASGSRGMAGGQAIDLESVGKELNLAELEILHIHKTGALIRAAVRLATLLNPAIGEEKIQALDRYAKCIGLAFQIRDDILDVEGETEILGKTQGKDLAQDKPTYPALLGLNGAREKAQELLAESLQCLNLFAEEADPLRWIAEYIIGREH
jgi:farnesyl diphosphate synthase